MFWRSARSFFWSAMRKSVSRARWMSARGARRSVCSASRDQGARRGCFQLRCRAIRRSGRRLTAFYGARILSFRGSMRPPLRRCGRSTSRWRASSRLRSARATRAAEGGQRASRRRRRRTRARNTHAVADAPRIARRGGFRFSVESAGPAANLPHGLRTGSVRSRPSVDERHLLLGMRERRWARRLVWRRQWRSP